MIFKGKNWCERTQTAMLTLCKIFIWAVKLKHIKRDTGITAFSIHSQPHFRRHLPDFRPVFRSFRSQRFRRPQNRFWAVQEYDNSSIISVYINLNIPLNYFLGGYIKTVSRFYHNSITYKFVSSCYARIIKVAKSFSFNRRFLITYILRVPLNSFN